MRKVEQEHGTKGCHETHGLTLEAARQQTQWFWLARAYRGTWCPIPAGSIQSGPMMIIQVPEARPRLPLTTACLIFSRAGQVPTGGLLADHGRWKTAE